MDQLGEIYVAGQTNFRPEMIANVLILNEMINKYQVTFYLGAQNSLSFILEIILFSFQLMVMVFILVNWVRSFLVKCLNRTKVK